MIEETIGKVKKAEAEAEEIVADAKRQARDIRQDAEAKAKQIVEDAQKDAAAKRHETLEAWRAEEREHAADVAAKQVSVEIPAELSARVPASVDAVKQVILAG